VRIERMELRLLRMPLVRFFETSFGRVTGREFVLVTVEQNGAAGVGECVADADPYYSAETTISAWHIIRDFIAPIVLERAIDHPRELSGLLRHIRGHNMAKAAVEMAAWDLFARQQGQALSTVLGGERTSIECGVSIGIQDSLDELVERVAIERAAGYRRVKIKIKPGWDVDAVARVREACGPIPLMVDANAAYTLDDAEHLASLDRFDLLMIEQPLEYDDIRDHAVLQRRLSTPICLDESIDSVRAAAGRVPHHQHQAGTPRRPWAVDPGARSCTVLRHAGVARRHAGERDRPGPQHSSIDAAELHAARRRRGEPPLLRARSDRPGDRRDT
jgi:O-succinylbenzoate synthase